MLQDLEEPNVHKILQLDSIENGKANRRNLTLLQMSFFNLTLLCYLGAHIDSFNFDEEIGTSNGKYTLGEMFWTATNLFGAR